MHSVDTLVTPDNRRQQLVAEYNRVRQFTETLCAPLQPEDYQIQSIIQTSPPKWHLAHVSWFFEAFLLPKFKPGYQVFNTDYDHIFNSYYYTHGQMHPRAQRGMLARPTVEDVYRYRAHVDAQMCELIDSIDEDVWQELAFYVELGINHEEQHQELMLMDIKHNFSVNPLKPSYRTGLEPLNGAFARPMRWVERSGGIYQIGSSEQDNFAYDNETPRHDVLLQQHRLADRLVTNSEYLEFIEDGAYQNPALWMSDGWALLQREQWTHPLYWQVDEQGWSEFTLGGLRDLDPLQPVCHISYYEADAYARWAGKRLPTESEMECLLAELPVNGNFCDNDSLHPAPAQDTGQWYGDLWAWTASPYTAYPGFKPLAGFIGEYNGKFMSNQMVLKGGCCATPHGHMRASYRNFFYPDERWAFTGLRLADDA